MLTNEFVRYIINGVVATLVHFGVLNFNINVLKFSSFGLANMLAAVFGISVSFIGSRYFVYKNHSNSIYSQLLRFGLLYGAIALLHGSVLYLWSDLFSLDFRLGFLLATCLQVILSYVGNKILVFKSEK